MVNDGKTAANIVPLILIPNIILGGALIKYEDMNRNLDLIYSAQRFFSTHPKQAENKRESELQVPWLCEFMPMRWSYEAMVVAQSKLNPLTSRQDRIQRELDQLKRLPERTPVQENRFEDLKDALAFLSGLESVTPEDVDRRLHNLDKFIAGGPLDQTAIRSRRGPFTAERLYVNNKITDLVSKAETDQSDYRRMRRQNQEPPYINVFFGPQKYFRFGDRDNAPEFKCSMLAFNTVVLVCFSMFTLGLLHFTLRRQLRT